MACPLPSGVRTVGGPEFQGPGHTAPKVRGESWAECCTEAHAEALGPGLGSRNIPDNKPPPPTGRAFVLKPVAPRVPLTDWLRKRRLKFCAGGTRWVLSSYVWFHCF